MKPVARKPKYTYLCPDCGEYEDTNRIASACPKCGKQGKRVWTTNVHYHPTKSGK